MSSLKAALCLALAGLLLSTSALVHAQAIVSDDAFVASSTPKTNYGNNIALIVIGGSNAYVKFNLANLGTGVTGTDLSMATVVLYADLVATSGTMDVYQVAGSWSEGTITWSSAPVLGAKILSAVPVSKAGYLSLNVTTTVLEWLNGTLPNNGIALVPTAGSPLAVSFDSKENILTSHPAQLALALVSAGPQGVQGIQGPQGQVGPQGPAGVAGPQGPVGPIGAQGPQGAAGADGLGFNLRNAFDTTLSYAPRDVVTYNGSSYVAIAASTGPNNSTPDTNTGAWSLIAQAGAPGVAGANGAPGPAGTLGIQGPMGPVGPQGPQGQAGTGGGLNGFSEYTSSGTLTVPAGVTHILVELWGAGGGGGGGLIYGANCDSTHYIGLGGGGGGGAYTRAVVAVTAGKTYTVSVGAAGIPGSSGVADLTCATPTPALPGGAGGDSQILDGATALISASGGQGGSPAIYPVTTILGTDTGGAGGAGGVAASGAGLLGRAGTPGSRPFGGTALIESLTPIGTNGGPGGGAPPLVLPLPNSFAGAPGGPGYVLVTY